VLNIGEAVMRRGSKIRLIYCPQTIYIVPEDELALTHIFESDSEVKNKEVLCMASVAKTIAMPMTGWQGLSV
jgi:hypothetical protein